MDNTISDIKQIMTKVNELKKSKVLRTLTNLQLEIHNKTRWSGKCKMLHNRFRIRSELIELVKFIMGTLMKSQLTPAVP